MPRKSKVAQLPDVVRKRVDKLLRAGTHTLDQIISMLRTEFGEQAEDLSRSALGRHAQRMENALKKMRESRDLARVWVQEIGEQPDGDSGRLMTQMLQSLINDHLLHRVGNDAPETKLGELKALSQTIKAASESGRLTLQQADLIEKRAREKLLREQQEKLEGMADKGAITAEVLAKIKTDVYGL